jgi:hypothetical protein
MLNTNFDLHNLTERNFMKSIFSNRHKSWLAFAGLIGALVLGSGLASAAESKLSLVGAEETPPVKTTATGTAAITVNDDKSVTGTVTTQGLAGGTVAHIHFGAMGKKGPPIITLNKTADNTWMVPPGSKFTDEQYASYKAGDLYINVHSAANKDGEIRGQIKP